jgi:hypothetical protein
MDLDLQSLFGLHVHSCTHWLRPRNFPPPPPSPRIWAHIRGRYWSSKIDDISLWPPDFWCLVRSEKRSALESIQVVISAMIAGENVVASQCLTCCEGKYLWGKGVAVHCTVYSSYSHRARQILPSSLNRQGEGGCYASLEVEGPLVGLELSCNVMLSTVMI